MQPEKVIIFGPIIIFFVIFGGLVVGFLVVVAKLIAKGKKSAWKGILVDKLHKTKDEYDSNQVNHFYTLVFKTEEGKEIKVGTSKEMYDSYNIGDKAVKKSGALWQTKIG
jgi:hypothetical protein